MMQIYHTVYENTKRKINSFACFNKTYHIPRPLDIGTFVLKKFFSCSLFRQIETSQNWTIQNYK